MTDHGDRLIGREWLDDAPEPAVAGNLADLRRINRMLGGHRIVQKLLRDFVNHHEPFSFLDAGAASGDMGEAVRHAYPHAALIHLDRKERHLRDAPGLRIAADAQALPLADASVDIAHASLLLHHFPEPMIVRILKEMKRVSRKAIIVTDLQRHWVPQRFLGATCWLFGWQAITVHDGSVSVRAGFNRTELEHCAREACLRDWQIRQHWPWFRLSLVAPAR